MTDEQKAKERELAKARQARWRDAHPEKVVESAKRSSERRKERYNDDPGYRAAYRKYQNDYVKNRRDAEGN